MTLQNVQISGSNTDVEGDRRKYTDGADRRQLYTANSDGQVLYRGADDSAQLNDIKVWLSEGLRPPPSD